MMFAMYLMLYVTSLNFNLTVTATFKEYFLYQNTSI